MNRLTVAFAVGKRRLLIVPILYCLVLLLPGHVQAQEQEIKPQTLSPTPVPVNNGPVSFTPLSNEQKFHHYLRHTYGPARILRSAVTAGVNQARNHTPEWGQGMEGYGRRFGSKFGQSAIKRTLQLGIGIWRDEDPRYFHSEHSGFWLRTRHALAYSFVTRMDDGSKGVAVSRLTSAMGAGLLSRTWQPERKRTIEDGLRSGVVSIGVDAGMRILQEFWPDIRHRFRRH